MRSAIAIDADTVVASAIDVLRLRAWARAFLWAEGHIGTIPDAVDPLQDFAERDDLIAQIGQDAVQQILADAFRSRG